MTLPQSLLAFSITAGLVTIMPGLDTALVLRTAAVEGARRAMLAGLGICAGCLVWGLAAAVGVGALLIASHFAYEVLRIAGAAYLVYLGIGMIRRRRAVPDSSSPTEGNSSGTRWFGRGLLNNLLNPKVGVFYMTLLPQFVPEGSNVVAVSALMALIHAVEGIAWFGLLTLATRPLAQLLQRPAVVHALDRATGGVFLLFGAKLALDARR